MLKAIEMELETGHYSLGVLQNALAEVGVIKAWYKELGDMDEDSEKFREIIWVLSDKAIIKADILTPDYVKTWNYQRSQIVQAERDHSIMQCGEVIKVTLQKVVLTFIDGRTLEMIRPRNRSNAEQFDFLVKLLG